MTLVGKGMGWLLLACLLLPGCGSSGETTDLVAPVITLDPVNPSTFEKDKRISGTVETGASLDVRLYNDAVVEDLLVAEGVWSCTIAGLEPGSNTVYVSASDADGDTNTLTFVLTYEVARVDQLVSPAPGATRTVRGTIVPGGSIAEVTLNGSDISVPIDYEGERWSFTLLGIPGLAEGENSIEILARDGFVEFAEKTLALTIIRDDSAPQLDIDIPPPLLDSHQLLLTGSVTEGTQVVVAVEPEATVGEIVYPTETTWEVLLSGLAERQNLVTVTASRDLLTAAVGWTLVTVETPASIELSLPPDGAQEVLVDSQILAIFDQAMVGSSIDAGSFIVEELGGAKVAGSIVYDADNRAAVFTPNTALKPGTDYTVTLTGKVADPAGTAIVPYSWSFTTVY